MAAVTSGLLLAGSMAFFGQSEVKTAGEALSDCGQMTDIDRRDSPDTNNISRVDGSRLNEDVVNIGSCVDFFISEPNNLVRMGSIGTGELVVVYCADENFPVLGVITEENTGWVTLGGSALQTYKAGGFEYPRPCEF